MCVEEESRLKDCGCERISFEKEVGRHNHCAQHFKVDGTS